MCSSVFFFADGVTLVEYEAKTKIKFFGSVIFYFPSSATSFGRVESVFEYVQVTRLFTNLDCFPFSFVYKFLLFTNLKNE